MSSRGWFFIYRQSSNPVSFTIFAKQSQLVLISDFFWKSQKILLETIEDLEKPYGALRRVNYSTGTFF